MTEQKTFREMLANEPEQSQSLYIKNGQVIEFKEIVAVEESA